jgi:hypothetical protein
VRLLRFEEKRNEPGSYVWKPFGNYSSVESACAAIIEDRMKESDAKEVRELIWEIRRAREDITTEIRKVQVKDNTSA